MMTATHVPPPPPRPAGTWLFPVLLAAIFLVVFLANISFSYRWGRLSTVPGYDDVAYFADALKRLHFGPDGALSATIGHFLAYPAHSPVSSATAMLGFFLFGPEPVAAYMANGWVLALFIVALARISRPLNDVLERTLFVAVFVFAPVAHAMVNAFMPDMAAGLVLAIALSAICAFDIATATLRRKALLVALAVAASVIKPTAVVLTIPALGTAFLVMAISQGLFDREKAAGVLRTLAPLAAAYLLAMLPIAILQGPEVIPYIHQALFSNADIWRTDGDLGFHLGYHFIGFGGQTSLSLLRWIGLAVIAFDLFFMVTRPAYRQRSGLNFYATLLVIYTAMAFSNEKTLFQGSLFYVPFLFVSAQALVRVLMELKRSVKSGRAAGAVLGAIVGILALFVPLASAYTVFPPAAEEKPALMQTVVAELLRLGLQNERTEACRGRAVRFGVTDLDPFAAVSVEYEMAKLRISVEGRTTFFARTFDEALESLDDVDAAVILDPSVASKYQNFPGMAFNQRVFDVLRAKPGARVETIGTYEGKPVWLYVRPSCPSGV